jgi:hypothetical protein
MNLFKTLGTDYINLVQVTRFECDPHQVALHFCAESKLTLRGDDAKSSFTLSPDLAAKQPTGSRRADPPNVHGLN